MKTSAHKKPRSDVAEEAHECKAKQMVAKLRLYHKLGLQAEKAAKRKNRRTPSHEWIVRIAQKYGLNEDTLRKARVFAREYSHEDLDELCGLRRSKVMPLHWGHVQYLLSVPEMATRKRLQRRAVRENWTAPDLYWQIRKQTKAGRGYKGGRELKRPRVPTLSLYTLVHDARTWQRRYDLAKPGIDALRPRNLGPDHRERLENAISALDQMAKGANQLARDLEKKLESKSKRRIVNRHPAHAQRHRAANTG